MKRGTIFEHKHWLDIKHMPLLCIVTTVRHDMVHWRALENGKPVGSSYRFPVDHVHRYIKQILEAA